MMKTDCSIYMEDISLSYSTTSGFLHVIARVDLSIQNKELVCLVGRSGCGKTSLLTMLSGLLEPTRGIVKIMGNHPSCARNEMKIGYVTQEDSLLPWRTVRQNVELPLTVGMSKRVYAGNISLKDCLVEEMISSVRLEGFEEYYPYQLSGGMKQRLALARSLVYKPEILFLDESFANLDEVSRRTMQSLILDLRDRLGITILMVTHDISEAMTLADRVVIFSGMPSSVVGELDLTKVDMDSRKIRNLQEEDEIFDQILSLMESRS